jgi:hypothetical protein
VTGAKRRTKVHVVGLDCLAATELSRSDDPTIDRYRTLSPQQAAVLLVADLQRLGAVFTMGEDGYFLCDLNPIKDMTWQKADDLSQAVLGLRHEIKALLLADRVEH